MTAAALAPLVSLYQLQGADLYDTYTFKQYVFLIYLVFFWTSTHTNTLGWVEEQIGFVGRSCCRPRYRSMKEVICPYMPSEV